MTDWSALEFTHTGKVRTLNEDSVLDFSAERLWAVADGMGGHQHGDYASQLVTRQLHHFRRSAARGTAVARITSLLEDCNRQLQQKAADDGGDIIGCTVAVLSIHGRHAVCSWSGDSRVYRVRNGALRQLTRDHNYQNLLEDSDCAVAQDLFVADGQMLTSAVGGDHDLHLEHCWYHVEAQDRFLLCTDGLYKEVDDTEILDALNAAPGAPSPLDSLAALYLGRGARDNIGMVLVSAAA